MKRRNTHQMKKIMVLSTILLGCLLVMTVHGDSSVQGKEELGYKNKLGVSQKEPIFVRSGAGYMRKLGYGGGKKFSAQHEVTSVESKNGEGETSKISGATYSDGICIYDEREGDAKIVKCKGEKSSIKPRKLKMDGFVAFTDDYHGPRHHIPKHN